MSVLQNAEFARFENVVACIAHRTKDHTETEVVVNPKTKETRKSCEKYPSIACAVHESFLSVGLQYSGTPAGFICAPDGAPLVKNEGGKSFDSSVRTLIQKLEETQQKLGRPVPRALYDKVVADLAQADRDVEDGRFDKAVKAIQKHAEDKKLPQALKDGRVKDKLAALDAKGAELLEEAKGKRDSAPEEALKLAKKVQKEFKGLGASDKAAELVKEWEGK